MSVDIYKRIFYFSPTAAAEMKKVEGLSLKMPWVIANGVKKQFTEMVNKPSRVRYKDSIKIYEGDIRTTKYFMD